MELVGTLERKPHKGQGPKNSPGRVLIGEPCPNPGKKGEKWVQSIGNEATVSLRTPTDQLLAQRLVRIAFASNLTRS